jgi:hypothetical protein
LPRAIGDRFVTIAGLRGENGHGGEQEGVIQRTPALRFFYQGQRAPIFAFGFRKLPRVRIGSSENTMEFDQLPVGDVRMYRDTHCFPESTRRSRIVP